MPKGTDSKVLANNKRASFDYAIEDTIEAGLVLTGTEIKSVRKGKISIGDAFVRFDGGEAILWNSNIAHFEQGNRYNHEQLRPRKLLLHKKQIANLIGAVSRDGYTIVPLKVYIKNGYAKCLIGLGRGKKKFDKRDDLKKKDAKRDIERALRDKQKY
ncbi:SsrA-binding protein [Exiguobacterium sp. Leaf187]|jgi:SsrA-binding protein|uniref:SsrA-binding protein n=1 Tax=Exiguobacterium indicum TaxID=296995 RepID=A0A0V8GIV0_9BACL|nr:MULTISPECIES: SsrA-binding protein SmpB [Exiguobacterium]AHA30577.1 single-stranded DNA-binding protein [Exiguobacterium sp. MH3]KQS20282.1 SsrA-binding protein [Exiguobacterium sp. Leaf187]KSU50176.1 SsrA-binding protein [Exiguobacterium enclense]KTR27512.1 single-stranded DNA-binding protein [Exiguobacterium indicum]KTR60167.1 single-stranded DNA-binding protein [Exiguobacterium indicum]